MNEKFFDLKKEKQDRMMNAALKVFAQNGYRHASTDDIVAEAGISKGLLFHYFGSKIGLYSFLYDYSARFMKLELTTGVDANEKDYFAIRRQMEDCRLKVLKNYPYMQLYLDSCDRESEAEAREAITEAKAVLSEAYQQLLGQANQKAFAAGVDFEKMNIMLEYTLIGLTAKHLASPAFDPEKLYEESVQYLDALEKMVKR